MSQNVSNKYGVNDIIDIEDLRKEYIRLLDKKLTDNELYIIESKLIFLE